MSNDVKHDFVVIVYDGRGTADRVYDILRDLEKRETMDIRTAAVLNRKPNGKIRLDHKRRITVAKGSVLGLLVGALVGGPLAGAVVGALIGSTRSRQRKELRKFIDDKLGPNQSALAVVINSADYPAVHEAIKHREGEVVRMELTPGSMEQLEGLMADEEVTDAVAAEVEEVEEGEESA